MFYHTKPGFIFSYDKYTCSFNGKFNLILRNSFGAIMNNTSHQIGFVVPCNYLRFIKTLNPKWNINTQVGKIFKFNSQDDESRFQRFVSFLKPLNSKKLKKIKEL